MTADTLKPEHSPSTIMHTNFNSAAVLASSGLFNDFLIYEQQGECWFGGGVARSITLFADRLECRDGDTLVTKQIETSELCQALAYELERWPGQWQAGGWACFELAYALSAPHLLNDEERTGTVPLLYLCQPQISLLLGHQPLRIQCQIPSLKRQVEKLLEAPLPPSTRSPSGVEITDSQPYRDGVREAVGRINDGVLEKVILSRKIGLDFTPDFVATWLLGRQQNTPSRSFSMQLGGWRASGFSPEIVMAVDRNRQVTTEPLAGTRRLDKENQSDLARFNELYSDPKETHEHAISVRMSVSEMEEICEPESITVHGFMERKKRGSVQHLASTVRGKLGTNFNAWHAFASLFPAVTASGIPKREAFAEISRFEKNRRGLYAGAILRADSDGTLDAALVLRSLLGHQQESWLQAGAGVVKGSQPERELTETSEKFASISPWVVRQD